MMIGILQVLYEIRTNISRNHKLVYANKLTKPTQQSDAEKKKLLQMPFRKRPKRASIYIFSTGDEIAEHTKYKKKTLIVDIFYSSVKISFFDSHRRMSF